MVYPPSRMYRRLGVLGVLVAALGFVLALPANASAARLARVAGGFDALTQVTAPRNGARAGVLFVVEQEGQIWRLHRGRRTLFLGIRGRVLSGGEQGLLSMAFSPNFARNRIFFVYYTDNGGNLRVVRYRANSRGTRARPRTSRVVLRVAHPGAGNHNGGQLAFGPNGRLYAGTGDGGGGCDTSNNAQSLRSRLGKLLSLNPANLRAGWRMDGYGLRNPWRFSFDRSTGRLYIGDVGQGSQEEVDTQPARRLGGARENYGWRVWEGRIFNPCGDTSLNPAGRHIRPIDVYGHGGGRCSVTGGFVYRGSRVPGLRGRYLFADYCSGEVWRLLVRRGRLVRDRRLVVDTALNISSFGEGLAGELYVATGGGEIYRFVRS
jgi:glucose/arabinose dehydrogenase